MYDYVPVVEQHPSRVEGAFAVLREETVLFQSLLDFAVNGTYLPLAFTAANYKIAGEATDLADIEQDNV